MSDGMSQHDGSSEALVTGDYVDLHSLISQLALSGKLGVLGQYYREEDRWSVQVDVRSYLFKVSNFRCGIHLVYATCNNCKTGDAFEIDIAAPLIVIRVPCSVHTQDVAFFAI